MSRAASQDAFQAIARLVHEDDDGGCLPYLSDPDSGVARLIATAGREQVLLAVLRRLQESGVDLEALSVPEKTYAGLRSAKVLPAAGDSRVSLTVLHERLETLTRLIHDLAADLALRLPYSWVAGYGAALRFAHPGYGDRVSNDLDLFTEDVDREVAVVHTLSVDLGFSLSHERTSEVQGTRVAYRRLRRKVESGHVLWVDLLTAGRPRARRLKPAALYPELFERARRVPTSSGGTLIPSAEDLLVLLAEKVIRKDAFLLRSTLDARAILEAEPNVDWDAVLAGSRRLGVMPGLAWLLDTAEQSAAMPLVTPEARRALQLPSWERLLLTAVSQRGNAARAWHRGARALQLYLWVARSSAGSRRQPLRGAR